MPPHSTRRLALQSTLALGATALGLPSARACEFFASTLRITHPWARASAEGQQEAVVSMRFDEVTRADRLIGVDMPLASGAELGGPGGAARVDLPIPEGQETLLSESGVHLRLLGLKAPLEVGRAYPMNLHFEHGGLVKATLTIDFARFA